MEEEGLPMPKTDVAYGATAAFAKHYPGELAAQNEKFNRASWQTRINETEQVQPQPVPIPSPPKMVRTTRPAVAPPDNTLAMALGALFFAGVAYLVFRGVQWHLLVLE